MQRNLYKGSTPRCCITLRIKAADGALHEREFLADTGCPCAVIVGNDDFALLATARSTGTDTNFGVLAGGMFELAMPELGLAGSVRGYGSNQVMEAVRDDSQDFAGLVGLPLLRRLEYGGDADAFWVRKPS